ncbi:hypothetical protein EIB71_05075 [Kaistella daneshvariae]|uniref:YtxH domain-containing protein n=1 Tax=Kaistella daneshvariae TaxID=2487074 RepID=A0ABM7C7W6_9FLAO|nr:hypothetical protein [Kaistella daneshvariae]AZI67077.1 hypothetical protein EIB71_05075 [Kaistella daneshvariae]
MKKLIFGSLISLLALSACEKKVTTTIEEDGDRTTVETVGLDKERIDSTAEKVGDKIEVAAEQTGEALKETGQNIKEKVNEADHEIKVKEERRETKKIDPDIK